MSQGVTLTPHQRALFLEHLAETSNVTASAEAAGFHRKTAYDWKNSDPDFSAAWDEAIEKATDSLEHAVRNRARDGVEEPIVNKDGVVFWPNAESVPPELRGRPATKRIYSDTLAALLLKAHRPDKYKDRSAVDMNMTGDLAAMLERIKGADDAG